MQCCIATVKFYVISITHPGFTKHSSSDPELMVLKNMYLVSFTANFLWVMFGSSCQTLHASLQGRGPRDSSGVHYIDRILDLRISLAVPPGPVFEVHWMDTERQGISSSIFCFLATGTGAVEVTAFNQFLSRKGRLGQKGSGVQISW